jgi:putative addiction module component (TIGR02574 family)
MNKTLRDQVIALPATEKVDLIMDAWDSIAPKDLPPLTDAQKAELDQRLADYQRNPSSAIPWEEAKVQLQARYRK